MELEDKTRALPVARQIELLYLKWLLHVRQVTKSTCKV